MKPIITTFSLLVLAVAVSLADIKVEAGPRKGRMLKLETFSAEFLVEKDRTISIAFYDVTRKQQAPAGQVITATAEAPGGKRKLDFDKKGDLLVSREPLPEGENYNVVVQVKETAAAKPQNFRIKLNLSTCKGCNNAEYACICDE